MPTISAGSSVPVTVYDNGTFSVASNAGFASVSITQVAGPAISESWGPGPFRKVYGPFKEGASVTLSSQTADVDYEGSPIPTSVSGGSVSVGGNLTVNAANAATYNGKLLIWSAAYTVTLAADLPTDFGFSGRPPATGNASIASANTGGLPTLDGATTTVTRALASNKLFAVVMVAANAYTVTGS